MNEELGELDLVGLMGRLQPVPEPAAISFWPETEAWLWLGLALVLIAGSLFRRWIRARRANAYRRAALREIAAAGNSAAALSAILRRTALAAFPRAEVAGLFGDDWLAFLDRTAGGTQFSRGKGRAFAYAPYVLESGGSSKLSPIAARWVRRHRREAKRGSG